MADLENELQEAKRIAREAGAILLKIYATDFDVEFKDRSDPVTEADKQANEFIVATLREKFPSDGIVAEETADRSDALKGGRCWFVDPLDGTKEFVKKNGEFAVMLGLSIDGESRLGVVYQPTKDKLYSGVVDHGAWLEEKGETRALNVSDEATPSALRLVVSRSHRSDLIDGLVRELGIKDERRSGSVGLKVGLIAEQIVDLYVHESDRASAWDACGPEAILRAAGGRFTRLDGKLYDYRREDVRNDGGIFACNAAAYDAVFPAARDVGRKASLIE